MQKKVKEKHIKTNTNPPPIPWENTFWDWQAIDANGAICIYKEKPTQGLQVWVPVSQAWRYTSIALYDPPRDFTKCIWKRPEKDQKKS